MPKLKYCSVVLISLLFVSCASDDSEDNCLKTISIPQIYFVGNQSYSYNTTQEVSCDFPEPTEAEVLVNPPELEGFTYDVINFEFIAETGNNTARLTFEIKLNNTTDNDVTGIPILITLTGGLQVSGSYSQDAISPCYSLAANSSCTLIYDVESSSDIVPPDTTVELVSVKYYLTN